MIGVSLISMVLGGDLGDDRRRLASEEPPLFAGLHGLRSAVLAVAAFALVLGLRRIACRLPPHASPPSVVETWIAAAGGSLIALAAALALLVDPTVLSRLVREDHLVEWTSAVLAFVAAGLYGVAATRRGLDVSGLLLGAMAGMCALLGLEEISWFQRVLEIESPDFMLNRNGQQEINVHNLATDLSGNLYYVGAFCWCVLTPALIGDRRFYGRFRWLDPLVPSPLVLLGSATAAAVVYEMWNIAWIQLTFWMTLAAVGIVGRTERWRPLAAGVALVTVVSAAIFLMLGDDMVRSWDDTEVRELIIPYGLALAGLEAARRAGSATKGRQVRSLSDARR